MEKINLHLNDPKEEDWNEFINHFHDPDLLYFYIKEIYDTKDVKERLNEVPDDKKKLVACIYKLEVFRATMQYVEEFAMYFLAYMEDYKNIGEKLVRGSTTKEVRIFFENLKNGKENEFSQKNKSMDFNDLLMELFGYNSFLRSKDYKDSKDKFDEMIKESIETIRKNLLSVAKYYLDYLKIYNALKHGSRIFPVIQNQMKLGDEYSDNNQKDSIIAICKDDGELAKPYTFISPLEYVIDESFAITKKTHSLFSYLRNLIRNKLIDPNKSKTSFFKSIPKDNPQKNYIKAIRNRNIMIAEIPDDFEYNKKPLCTSFAFKIVLKGKNIFFHTKFEKEKSLEYPFLVDSKIDFSSDLTPTYTNKIHFNFDLYDLHIGQYLDLVKISKLQENDQIKKITLMNDLTNEKIQSTNGNDINFPQILESPKKDLLKFLFKLEKATGELIPLPLFTSKKQDQIIDENINKKLSKVNAEEIVAKLKSNDSKMVCTIISTKIIDSNGKEISSRTFDPIPSELFKFTFKTVKSEKQFKDEIFEIPGKSIAVVNKIDEIPGDIIEKIELLVKGEIKELPTIEDVNLPLFELKTILSFDEPIFWYKEHFVTMIFRPVTYGNLSLNTNFIHKKFKTSFK